jgi:3-hydroxyisobutyrate dehydrogenase-like beta-hydroxyacid dehydrogenase
MPVSGSKVPAEEGRLVGMVAGNQRVAERLNPVLSSITAAAVYCGAIGSGLKTKYAVNLYLVTMTTGLAEAMNLARAQNLDLKAFGDVLNAGSLASAYSNMKIGKMIDRDWTTQAGISDCYNSTRLIRAAAETAHARTPLMDVCSALYKQANYCGLAKEDMIAIIKVLE